MFRLIFLLFGLALARPSHDDPRATTCFAQLERPLVLINVIIGANCQFPQNPIGIHLNPFARFILRPIPVAQLRDAPTPEEIDRYAHASEKMHAYFGVPVSRHRGTAAHFVHRNRFTHVIRDLKIDLFDLLTETVDQLNPAILAGVTDPGERDRRLDLFLARPSRARTQLWAIADFLLDFFDSRAVRDLSAHYRHDLRAAMPSTDRRRLSFELSDQLTRKLNEQLSEAAQRSNHADVRNLAPIITNLMGVHKVTRVAR